MCLPPHLLKYTEHLLRCCAQINPQRIKDTPAVNLCLRLVSAPSISKGLRQGIYFVAAHKLILNVSEAARMPLVPSSKVSAGVFCTLLAFPERTRMSVVPSSSELRQFTTSVL